MIINTRQTEKNGRGGMICVLCTLTEKKDYEKKQTVSKIKSNARIISLNIFLYTYNMTYPETED